MHHQLLIFLGLWQACWLAVKGCLLINCQELPRCTTWNIRKVVDQHVFEELLETTESLLYKASSNSNRGCIVCGFAA